MGPSFLCDVSDGKLFFTRWSNAPFYAVYSSSGGSGVLLSFSLFSWISFKLKTVNETGWQLALTGGFLITFLMFTLRLL